MILVKDLIEWAKQNAIGRSASYPDGAIRSLDLLRLATDCYGAEPLTYNPQNGLRSFRNLGQEVQE